MLESYGRQFSRIVDEKLDARFDPNAEILFVGQTLEQSRSNRLLEQDTFTLLRGYIAVDRQWGPDLPLRRIMQFHLIRALWVAETEPDTIVCTVPIDTPGKSIREDRWVNRPLEDEESQRTIGRLRNPFTGPAISDIFRRTEAEL